MNYFTTDAEDRRELAITEGIAALMAPGAQFDPLEPSNFDKALSETLAAFPSNDFCRVLAVATRNGTAAACLTKMATDYYFPMAQNLAEKQHAEAVEVAKDMAMEDRRDYEREYRYA